MATTTHKEPTTMSATKILSFETRCGRYTVRKIAGGWYFRNNETQEQKFLSNDTQEALDIAIAMIS
jgi:hypothetical protein